MSFSTPTKLPGNLPDRKSSQFLGPSVEDGASPMLRSMPPVPFGLQAGPEEKNPGLAMGPSLAPPPMQLFAGGGGGDGDDPPKKAKDDKPKTTYNFRANQYPGPWDPSNIYSNPYAYQNVLGATFNTKFPNGNFLKSDTNLTLGDNYRNGLLANMPNYDLLDFQTKATYGQHFGQNNHIRLNAKLLNSLKYSAKDKDGKPELDTENKAGLGFGLDYMRTMKLGKDHKWGFALGGGYNFKQTTSMLNPDLNKTEQYPNIGGELFLKNIRNGIDLSAVANIDFTKNISPYLGLKLTQSLPFR